MESFKVSTEIKLDQIDKKTKERIIRKSVLAVKEVLNKIAPGQVERLKSACFERETRQPDFFITTLQSTIAQVSGRNLKRQLLSIVYGKNEDDKYNYTEEELISLFPSVTRHDVAVSRKQASKGLSGIPNEPGKSFKRRLKDSQINQFLAFLQHGGVMQDVASGTRSVRLTNGRKVAMPNAVRTIHKAEIVRLYIGAFGEEGYTQDNSRPSTRTIWNMLNNCPATQRKSLSGLDNVAAEGSDSFDKIISICKELEKDNHTATTVCNDIVTDLIEGKRYLKGEYKVHCLIDDCPGVANHCRAFALSDPKEEKF